MHFLWIFSQKKKIGCNAIQLNLCHKIYVMYRKINRQKCKNKAIRKTGEEHTKRMMTRNVYPENALHFGGTTSNLITS